jgi:hypothetical protein
MSATGNNDAAALANAEDVIAQGDPSKLHELIAVLRSGAGPASLTSTFLQAATDADAAEHLTRTLTALNQQQQDKVTLQQQAAEKKEKDRREEAWLDSMTPEYRQAYGELMTTVDTADKQYDRLRQRLQTHAQQLDADAQDIDNTALHLSDGSRGYRNAEGELVDKNGVPLKGKNAGEAKASAPQHGNDISSFDRFQQNEQSRAETGRLLQRIDTEESQANQLKQDAKDHKIPDTATLQHDVADTKAKLAATTGSVDAEFGKNAKTNTLSVAGLSDLDGPSSPAPDHASFASKVDPNAGIKASGLSAPFNAATQAAVPAPATVPPLPKPAAAPAPA